jgi:hypothetical protein
MQCMPRSPLMAICFVGMTVGVLARETGFDESQLQTAPSIEASSRPEPPSPEEIARPHLDWAADEIDKVVDEHLRQVDSFFADTKKNTPQFADRALSWSSKWRFAADRVPFTHGGRHDAFIRSQFEEHLFTPAQLGDLVEQVVASYLAHLRSIEGEMLVKVKTDVADFPDSYSIGQLDQTSFDLQYNAAVADALAATSNGVRGDLATLLVSEIAGEVLAQVAVKLGVSAGILTTGAVSGWATFGVGLVVGLIVDQIVSWIWDWYADPIGSLIAQLDTKLDGLNRLIVDGSDDVEGLRCRLKAYAGERARLRETAVLAVLKAY